MLIRETILVGTSPVVAGTVVGLTAAALIAQMIKASFFGVSPVDPLAYLSVGMILPGGALVMGRRGGTANRAPVAP